MNRERYYYTPFVESIFHPSDFSKASESAFAHALALALLRKSKLTILHAGDSRDSWTNFPAIRATLERWGYLEEGSSREEVSEKLSLGIKKVQVAGRSPLAATLGYLQEHPTDLIVLATEGREGLPRWIQRSFAERVAQKSQTMTLFVPQKARGFISPENGSISLRRILVPVDHHPSPEPAVIYAARTAGLTGDQAVEIILIHIGDASTMPKIELPDWSSVTWRKLYRQGEVVQEILKAGEEYSTDLIVMSTAGHEGFLDALRGSVTEQVLRQSNCPLLAVPSS